MTEEKITLSIIKTLKRDGWTILSFDYPQSGTGRLIKPNIKEKNFGGFIPDIVSFKGELILFWENKDRFVLSDFEKLSNVRDSGEYDEAMSKFLRNIFYKNIYFGVGLPNTAEEIRKCEKHFNKTDFVFAVNVGDHSLISVYNPYNIEVSTG